MESILENIFGLQHKKIKEKKSKISLIISIENL